MNNAKTGLLKFTAVFFPILFILSCSKNGMQREPLSKGNENVSSISYTLRDYNVTQEGIKRQAQELINLLQDNTMRSTDRRIESITPICNQHLRSSNDTTSTPIAYIVNFSNDLGYTVLSADSRLEPVWVLSERGNLDLEKEPENPTVSMLMKQVELSYNLDHYVAIDCVGGDGGDGKPFYPSINPFERKTHMEYGSWTHIPGEKYEALIPVVWGQSCEPYNLYIPHDLSFHAGCVPAAVAQIMAFHSYPRSYDWKEMLKHHPLNNDTFRYKDAYPEIGRLYRDLGRVLKVKYSPEGSGAFSEDVPKTFRTFGYSNGGQYLDYSLARVESELKRENGRGFPVYISASDTMMVKYKHFLWWHWKEVSYNGGHAFVIDGISKAKRLVREVENGTGKEISRHYETIDMLRVNLGWNNSKFNGYYNSKVFDVNEGPILKNMTNSVYGKDYVFRYNFKTVTGIRP